MLLINTSYGIEISLPAHCGSVGTNGSNILRNGSTILRRAYSTLNKKRSNFTNESLYKILRKSMAAVAARGEGADEAAMRRCRLSEPPPETPETVLRRLHRPQPALRSAVVLVLLISGISPCSSNARSAGVARSAPAVFGVPSTGRHCLRIQGGGGSRERDGAADVTFHAKWQGPGQVRPPILLLCAPPGFFFGRRGR